MHAAPSHSAGGGGATLVGRQPVTVNWPVMKSWIVQWYA